jgi:hypothetical protein
LISFKIRKATLSGFLCGSAFLIICTILQKIITGFNPFVLNAYIVPFLFGGISGALLSDKCAKIKVLHEALLNEANELDEYLPICSHCKKIREIGKDPSDIDSWKSVEEYVTEKTSSKFSHCVCPDCLREQYPEFSGAINDRYEKRKDRQAESGSDPITGSRGSDAGLVKSRCLLGKAGEKSRRPRPASEKEDIEGDRPRRKRLIDRDAGD